jgi:hypothetical protein
MMQMLEMKILKRLSHKYKIRPNEETMSNKTEEKLFSVRKFRGKARQDF